MVLFGVAMGALFSVVYTVSLGRVGRVGPRVLALLVAGAGLLTLYLVPFVKYPANPPSIGHPATIGARGGLYLIMIAGSIIVLLGGIWLGRRLSARLGTWNAVLVAAAGFVIVIGVLMAVLPPLGHLAANVAEYGSRPTETPLPLRNTAGEIVYPGFPADTLFDFRFYSVVAQLIMWATIALAFGPLAERLLSGTSRQERAMADA